MKQYLIKEDVFCAVQDWGHHGDIWRNGQAASYCACGKLKFIKLNL